MHLTNHQFRMASRPVGMPKPSDWNYSEEAVREPANGEFLVKVLQISLDPAMRSYPRRNVRAYGVHPAGKLKSREDIVEGLQNFPEALLKLFTGENFGKLILKVAEF